MEEKLTNVVQEEAPFPFFAIIYKRLVLIILITVLGAMLSVAYCVASVRPTYTATTSVILRMSVGDETAGTVTTNVSLAKLYMPDVVNIMSSPKVIDAANDEYEGEGSVSSGAISVEYDEKSLVFSISYTDMSEEMAKTKLDTLINSASDVLANGAVEAKSVSLIPTQRDSSVVENSGFAKYIVLGTAAALILSVLLSMLLYALDNSVNDRKEIEDLTGVSVIAYISKPRIKDKK